MSSCKDYNLKQFFSLRGCVAQKLFKPVCTFIYFNNAIVNFNVNFSRYVKAWLSQGFNVKKEPKRMLKIMIVEC